MSRADQLTVNNDNSENKLVTVFRSLKKINSDESLFSEAQIAQIALASEMGGNFPIENWFEIGSVRSRALYFDSVEYFKNYTVWKKSGRKGTEPELNSSLLAATTSLQQIDSLIREPERGKKISEDTKKESTESSMTSKSKPTAVVLPACTKVLQTPQLARKKPVLPKSSSSSSLFKQKQEKSIYYSPLYIGKDILLKKNDRIFLELDATIQAKLIITSAVSFRDYKRIDGSTSDSDALKILKAELDKRGKQYRTLGSEPNGIANSSIVTRR